MKILIYNPPARKFFNNVQPLCYWMTMVNRCIFVAVGIAMFVQYMEWISFSAMSLIDAMQSAVVQSTLATVMWHAIDLYNKFYIDQKTTHGHFYRQYMRTIEEWIQ